MKTNKLHQLYVSLYWQIFVSLSAILALGNALPHRVGDRVEDCKDIKLSVLCKTWKSAGNCVGYWATWMETNCQKTCGKCPGKIDNFQSFEEYSVNYIYYLGQEPQCEDLKEESDCTKWKLAGNCEGYWAKWMETYCQKTCLKCPPDPGKLDKFQPNPEN